MYSGTLLATFIEIGQYLRKLCSNEGSELAVVPCVFFLFWGEGTMYLVYAYIFIIKSYRVQLINEKSHIKSDAYTILGTTAIRYRAQE